MKQMEKMCPQSRRLALTLAQGHTALRPTLHPSRDWQMRSNGAGTQSLSPSFREPNQLPGASRTCVSSVPVVNTRLFLVLRMVNGPEKT